MSVSADLLFGILVGAGLTLLIQQATRMSSRLMQPGCLLVGGLLLITLLLLVSGTVSLPAVG